MTQQIKSKAKALTKSNMPSILNKPSILRQLPLGNGHPGTEHPKTGLPGTRPPGTGLTGTGLPGTGLLGPPGPPKTYANAAATSNNYTSTHKEWTLVKPKAKPQKSEKTSNKSRRLILVKSVTTDFSSLALRNAFNSAFAKKGVNGPVVTMVTKSLGQNLVITTTSQFSTDYLLENRSI